MEHNSVNRLRLDSSFEHNIFIGNFFYFVKYLYLLIKYKTNTAYWKQTTWNKWFFQPVNESKWLHDSINVEQKAEQRTNRYFVSRLVVGCWLFTCWYQFQPFSTSSLNANFAFFRLLSSSSGSRLKFHFLSSPSQFECHFYGCCSHGDHTWE